MTEPGKAVFLSYASEDAEAAKRISDALRSAGIEVWFDQSELQGGDAWDQKIRQHIRDCALFVPIISADTNRRDEGYFRREWMLAVDRTRDMAHNKPFLVPVVLDDTSPATASVPEKFKELQWVRLMQGNAPDAFVDRVSRLLGRETTADTVSVVNRLESQAASVAVSRWLAPIAGIAILSVAFAYILHKWTVQLPVATTIVSDERNTVASSSEFKPPPHSLAVMPFTNMSGDKEQEYFSDGLSEELLNALAHVKELQVAARTSSFSFKGKSVDIGTIARQLNVASILEGSVRRSGRRLRVTAELNNAITGYHLWSQSYDRNIGDVLVLQTDIANAVAKALRVTLLAKTDEEIKLGGTQNADAFEAYLRAMKFYQMATDEKGYKGAIDAYSEAIHFDPQFALAFAGRSLAYRSYGEDVGNVEIDKALFDAKRALELAPDLPEAHLAMGSYFVAALDAGRASEEYKRAAQLAPGNVTVLQYTGSFAVKMGRFDEGIAAIRRATDLDRLDPSKYLSLASALQTARRPKEALVPLELARTLDAGNAEVRILLGYSYYYMGEWELARENWESLPAGWQAWMCLSMVYHKLGRQSDAQEMLTKVQDKFGIEGAYGYMLVYAQWGEIDEALRWAEIALQQRDIDLLNLKEPTLDPLRGEPRFKAIERALRLPE